MEKESVEVCNNWQEMPEFTDCISALDALPSDIKDEAGTKTRAGKETTNDQMEQFFKVYSEVAIKNFAIWKKNGIQFALASSNFKSPMVFANWYLDRDLSGLSNDNSNLLENYEVHPNCTLTTSEYLSFLATCQTRSSADPIISRNLNATEKLLMEI